MRKAIFLVWLVSATVLFRLGSTASAGLRGEDEEEEESGGGSASGGPKKRGDWLQPVLPQTVAVPKEPSDEKAIRLIQQMKLPWEGMEDPRLEQTHEGMDQSMRQFAKSEGVDSIPSAGTDTGKPEGKLPKLRPGVPQLPPVHVQRTLLWNPKDILAQRWTPVAEEWDRDTEKKMVDEMSYHPLRIWSDRTSPMWSADVRSVHNARYKKKFQSNKKYIPPNMRLNPPFFPHPIARYTDRVPSSDLNANPVEWPVQPRFIGERKHSPYDQWHENPDRYQAPFEKIDWHKQQKSRQSVIWPKSIAFPRMPAPVDTYNQMLEVDTKISRNGLAQTESQAIESLTDQLSTEINAAINSELDESQATEQASGHELDDQIAAALGPARHHFDADAMIEADSEDESEGESALVETEAEAEAESESEAEAESESELTPKEQWWYWVQPYQGKDRFGRSARLFTPSNPRHFMYRHGPTADAATGHSARHVAVSPIPTYHVDGVSVQHQSEKFDNSAALPVADLQHKLDKWKENPTRLARYLLNDDRAPYLFTDGKQDEADYAAAPGPTAAGNKYDAIDKANRQKQKSKVSPWLHGPDGDLRDRPGFPYASFRRDYLGQVRGTKVPIPQPALKYAHIKAGSKSDFPISYAGKSFVEVGAGAESEADSESESEDESEIEQENETTDEDQLDSGEYQLEDIQSVDEAASADEAEVEAASQSEAGDTQTTNEIDASQLAMTDEEAQASDEADEAGAVEAAEENPVFLDLSSGERSRAPHAMAHIPSELHGAAPRVVAKRPPPAIHLDENGEPIERSEAEDEQEMDSDVFAETQSKANAKAKAAEAAAAAKAEADKYKPWWTTKAGRARNNMPEALRNQQTTADPAHVLDQAIFRSAYSAPIDIDKDASELTPRGGAAALLDSLAALARNPLSDAPNVFAGQPKSAADRSLSEIGESQAMEMAGIDGDAPRREDSDSGEAPSPTTHLAGASAHSAMRFKAGTESSAVFDADFRPSPHGEANEQSEAGKARFAEVSGPGAGGAPKVPKESTAGYGVGLRGMILTQDAAIIAGPNRYRSPTLVNPFSVAMARAQQPYGPAGPIVPIDPAAYPNYPYNYPNGFPMPNVAPATAAVGGPRGVSASSVAGGAQPTTVVNIYGASGAVTSTAATGAKASVSAPAAAKFAYPAPMSAPGLPVPGPLPYGDTFPPAAGPYPPPLSGLMDIAYSMQGRSAPGVPPTPLFGHPFQKVPIPQFPPSSPTVPYPRYPLGPTGALTETGWQKPRIVPIVYGTKA